MDGAFAQGTAGKIGDEKRDGEREGRQLDHQAEDEENAFHGSHPDHRSSKGRTGTEPPGGIGPRWRAMPG